MDEAPYKKLARHLDKMPGGYPSTKNGLEIRLLKRLFTPEEANLACHLTPIPETAGVIAFRAHIDTRSAAEKLEEMARKGLIYRFRRRGQETRFSANQFVVGIWEFHVNDLDPELIKDMNEYIPTLLDLNIWKKSPQLRTIPVGKSIDHKMEILPHENAEEMVKKQKRFLVAPCICRRERRMMGEGCDKPEESCLIFGRGVEYYLENGLGREITLDETLEILHRAEKSGLVLQPSNSKKIVNICCCCGCCCQVLKNIKRHPRPAEMVSSPFRVVEDRSLCRGCEVCLERCPMEAVTLEDGKVKVNQNRCIGCGLCVTTCPEKALSLVRKPQAELKPVPSTWLESLYRLGKLRRKIGPLRVALMKWRSWRDRRRVARMEESL